MRESEVRNTFIALIASLAAMPLRGAEIVLAPDGPIRTVVAARDAARSAAKPATIVVEAGVYPVTDPLVLGPEDANTTWRAKPGAKPAFSGGRTISGWRQEADGKWSADIPDVRDGKWYFEQLWIDGRRATRARTPNKGYLNISHAADPSVFPGAKDLNFRAFSLTPEHFAILAAIPPEERKDVLVTVTHAWAVGQCRIESLHAASQSVLIQGRSRYPFVEYEPDQRYWLENYRAALDSPGEWYLDRKAGVVFYRPLPEEDMTRASVVAPAAERLLSIANAKEIRFEELTFEHTNYQYPAAGLHDMQAAATIGAAVEVENAAGIHFENCAVGHVGQYAIFFKNGCSQSSVRHCHLHDLGAGGVRVGEINRPEEERICREIVVDDSILQHGGRLHPSACGVLFTHTQRCSVVHCDIGDFFYTGVSAGWNWGYGESVSRENRVEDNHIHHLGWAYLSDMGGFYGLGTAPGTIVRGNHIHHIASHRYGGWGLYNDEGSADVLMENNLVHDTSDTGFHQHYGYANRIRNNIFAFGKRAQVHRSRNESRLTIIFERNIVVWDPASPLLDGGEANWKLFDKPNRGDPKDSVIFRKNLYWPTDGKIPEHLTKSQITWAEWRKLGRDAGSLFADPKFEDLARRDFRLKADSPADKIGFKPWDLTLAGVRKDGDWAELAAEGATYPNWDADAQPWPAPDYRIPLQTFENVTPGSIGIRNASYHRADKGESIGVSEEAASPIAIAGESASRRSLRFEDSPSMPRSFEPVLDIDTRWQAGSIRVSFDAMAQPGADWFFEARTHRGGEYGAGPMVSWKKGVLSAGLGDKTKLADIPPGEWFRISVAATTSSGLFDVSLTRQDGSTLNFPAIPCKPSWDASSYLLFSSLGSTKTSFFIDNLRLERSDQR